MDKSYTLFHKDIESLYEKGNIVKKGDIEEIKNIVERSEYNDLYEVTMYYLEFEVKGKKVSLSMMGEPVKKEKIFTIVDGLIDTIF